MDLIRILTFCGSRGSITFSPSPSNSPLNDFWFHSVAFHQLACNAFHDFIIFNFDFFLYFSFTSRNHAPIIKGLFPPKHDDILRRVCIAYGVGRGSMWKASRIAAYWCFVWSESWSEIWCFNYGILQYRLCAGTRIQIKHHVVHRDGV